MRNYMIDGVHSMLTFPNVRFYAAFMLATALTFGGCVTPDEIDRVQPNLISKADLTGEWYIQDTVTAAPYTSTVGFIGYQGDTDRGVFEVEEKHLYLYRTYEFIQGVETQGIRGDTDTPVLDDAGEPLTYQVTLPDGTVTTATRYIYRSTPIGRWAISAHVDIRQSYNALTGEESNVTVEDASEKYWYQRDYIRVNFGADSSFNVKRLGTTGSALGTVYEGEVASEGLNFRVEDDAQYMDWVVRHMFPAPQAYLPGFGNVPLCLFYAWYTGAYYECDVQEIQVRTSLRRVDPNNEYMSLNYNDHMMARFGFFRNHRQQWDENFGSTFTDATRQANRWNLFKNWVVDAEGNLDYTAMQTQPVVYYLSENFPPELMPGALDLQAQWNTLFTKMIRILKGDETFNEPMYVLCENNNADLQLRLAKDPSSLVAETDPAICGDMDAVKYLGDLRFPQLNSINEPTQVGLYGYGPSATDPLTGQTIHANANMYTANIRLGAWTAVDMIEYEAGVQNFRDVTQSEHIVTSLKSKTLKGTQRAPRSPKTVEQAQVMASTVMPTTSGDVLAHHGIEMHDSNWSKARAQRLLETTEFDFLWKNADMATLMGAPVFDLEVVEDVDGVLKELAHPAHMVDAEASVDRYLKRQESLGLEAIDMAENFDDTIRGLSLEYKAVYDQRVCEGLQEQGAADDNLIFDFDDFNEPGAACSFVENGVEYTDTSVCAENQVCTFLDQGDIQRKYCITPCNTGDLLDQLRSEIRRVNQISPAIYWDPNALYSDVKDDRVRASQLAARALIEEVRQEVFEDVFDRMWSTIAIHEVGHTVGLRHNFASSTDALNYFEDYWSIKGSEDAEGNWYPMNLWEGETRNQTAQRMRENQQTSVMEYGSGFNSRYKGLGSYDYAAMYFAYGGLLQTFNKPIDWTTHTVDLEDPQDDIPSNYGLAIRHEAPLAKVLRRRHHTNFPSVFGDVKSMYDRSWVAWEELVLTETVTAEDGSTSTQKVACTMMDDPYDNSVCPQTGSFCSPFPTGFYCTKPDTTEVPYRFCSDEYNFTSPTCQTRDEGADMFEIVTNSIDDYEAYWPFRAYKRDNPLFFPGRTYYGSIYGYMIQWRKHFEHWAYDYSRFNAPTESGVGWWESRYGKPWHLDINGGLSETLAAQAIFDQLANIFGRPSTGYYGWNEERSRYEPVVNNGKNTYCAFHDVYEDTGARPMYPSYDFSGYIYTPSRGGTFYDRMLAMQMMTTPYMLFAAGVDRQYDIRRFRMSFADIWPQRMQNILSGLVTGDPAPFGWCIEHVFPDSNPEKEIGCGKADPSRVKPRLWFGTDEELDAWYDNCEPLTIEPEYTFPTTQYRLPALATIYGMINLAGAYDQTFTDRMRLWLEGEATDITIPAGFEKLRYEDPFSGKVYVAAYDPEEFSLMTDAVTSPPLKIKPRDTLPREDIEEHGHKYWPAAWIVARLGALLAETVGDGQCSTSGDLCHQNWHCGEGQTCEGLNMTALSESYAYSELQQMLGRAEIIRALYRRLEFGW